MDVVIVDVLWNGIQQTTKIASMNAHWAAAVPNLRIMETDIERLPWDDDVFTTAPDYQNGKLQLPDDPGWECEPDEAALEEHPSSS
ncbi:enolase C-terminal domain-like protein [Halopenitus sp. H-Gu1]|uniref:enolase C-terminal domain-like protein n=1 Tax=Halopenitus sp. H-Gu1 TaxID=3242697 RepID=UPI00359DDF4C